VTAEFSSNIRLGAMLCILALSVSSLAVIYYVSMSRVSETIESTSSAFESIGSSTLVESSSYRRVGAPTAYKMIQRSIISIDQLTIQYKDGTTTSDITTLLDRANKFVRIEVKDSGYGKYQVLVRETS